jgi:hypothetical protein
MSLSHDEKMALWCVAGMLLVLILDGFNGKGSE